MTTHDKTVRLDSLGRRNHQKVYVRKITVPLTAGEAEALEAYRSERGLSRAEAMRELMFERSGLQRADVA